MDCGHKVLPRRKKFDVMVTESRHLLCTRHDVHGKKLTDSLDQANSTSTQALLLLTILLFFLSCRSYFKTLAAHMEEKAQSRKVIWSLSMSALCPGTDFRFPLEPCNSINSAD
jgi:Fe2+ transport system protein B